MSATLLPPNASPQERALVRAAVQPLPVRITDLWNPDTCPADLLPWLAWALSIDTWKPYWPESIKRARIRVAIEVQRAKGTVKAVRQVVQSFGGSVELTEWFQTEPTGTPHTFQMVLALANASGGETSAQFVDDVIAEVVQTKPARSHFTFTQGVEARGRVGMVAAARVASYRRLQLEAS